jgi:hypothetical protein
MEFEVFTITPVQMLVQTQKPFSEHSNENQGMIRQQN